MGMRLIVTETDYENEDCIFVCEQCGVWTEDNVFECKMCGSQNIVREFIGGDEDEL